MGDPALAEESRPASSKQPSSSSSFGGWLQRVRRTGEHSDVLVRFGDTAEFHLHLLPLKNASSFFRELEQDRQPQEQDREQAQIHRETSSSSSSSSGSGSGSGKVVVELGHLLGGPAAFSMAADFCYLVKPAYTFANVARLRSVAAELGMPDLLDSSKRFLYTNVFSHWRSCTGFLQHYSRFGDPVVDDYIESRCLKVVAAALTKAFSDTKHVSVPLPRSSAAASTAAAAARSSITTTKPAFKNTAAAAASSSSSTNFGSSSSPGSASAGGAVPVSASGIAATTATTTWHCSSSPCSSLTEVLVTVAARLPDAYMAMLVATLVEAEVNLSLKCRQGRNVRAWLAHVLRDECSGPSRHHARCWIVIALAEMLLRRSSSLELSSQYWCSLLEHVEELVLDEQQQQQRGPIWNADVGRRSDDLGGENGQLGPRIYPRLRRIRAQLEERIGASLHELDDYLHSYRFSAPTLLSLVSHFVTNRGKQGESLEQLEEVASEVDGCLWIFAEEAPTAITPQQFLSIFTAFPAECRASHDSLYASIERMVSRSALLDGKNGKNAGAASQEAFEALWGLVDCDKLSSGVHERALNNPSFLCQPHVLERVLRIHSEELMKGGGQDQEDGGDNLKNIIHKVIKASLKLLEENSRRSKEIVQLQSQYSALLLGKSSKLRPASVDQRTTTSSATSAAVHPGDFGRDQEEVDEDLLVDEEDDMSRLHCRKKNDTEDEEEEHVVGVVQAPQTPIVEARRSLQSVS